MKCFRLRCYVNNSFLVFHQGTKHSKTIKHSRFALVFHTVFSCLDPLMKHSNSLFTYNIKYFHLFTVNYSRFPICLEFIVKNLKLKWRGARQLKIEYLQQYTEKKSWYWNLDILTCAEFFCFSSKEREYWIIILKSPTGITKETSFFYDSPTMNMNK